MRILLTVFFFFCLYFGAAGIGCCAGPQPEKSAAPQEDALPDFSKLRDPFLSALPKVEKVKTPVAQNLQNVNNRIQQNINNAVLRPIQNIQVRGPMPGPVQPPKKKAPELRVNGIIWSTPQPQAIINNTVVGVGDMVSGVKIYSIQKDDIVVLFEGDKIHVHMEE